MPNLHEQMVVELDREIEQLRIVRDYHAAKAQQESGFSQPPIVPVLRSTARPQPQHRLAATVSPVQQADINEQPRHLQAAVLLRAAGKPMSVPAIVSAAKVAGVDFGGKDKTIPNAFYTAMARHPELFDKTANGWALVEWKGSAG